MLIYQLESNPGGAHGSPGHSDSYSQTLGKRLTRFPQTEHAYYILYLTITINLERSENFQVLTKTQNIAEFCSSTTKN